MAVTCFDPSESDSLLHSSCYCSETSWESGDLAFLDDAVTVGEEGIITTENDVQVCDTPPGEMRQVPSVEPPTRVAISAPTTVQRQRAVSSEAHRFVASCRESLQAPDGCLLSLAGSLSPEESSFVRSLCKRRGPRRRLQAGKGLSRTTTNNRARLAWCTLEELLGSSSSPCQSDLPSGNASRCANLPSLPSLLSSPSSEQPCLSGDALQLADGMRLDKQLAGGLAEMFSRHKRYLQEVVENLGLPLQPPEDQ